MKLTLRSYQFLCLFASLIILAAVTGCGGSSNAPQEPSAVEATATAVILATETAEPELLPTPTLAPSPEVATPTADVVVEPATTTPEPEDSGVTVARLLRNANIRSGPGEEYEIVGLAAAGDELTVYGISDNGWVQVDAAGRAWIGMSLVEVTGPRDFANGIPAPPPAAAADEAAPAADVQVEPTAVPEATPTEAVAAPPEGGGNHTFSGDTVDPPWWPCEQGQVKGNEDSMIYHVPGGSFYAKTYDGVVCFNSAEEAAAAGFRTSER